MIDEENVVRTGVSLTLLVLLSSAVVGTPFALFTTDDGEEFFRDKVAPILEQRCLKCHNPEKFKGKLDLTTRAGLLRGGREGPAAVVGNVDESQFLLAISYTDPDFEMPPTGRISGDEISILSRWVSEGILWPRDATLEVPEERQKPETDPLWCDLPLQRPEIPAVLDRSWITNPIDAFLLARLEEKNLQPSPIADERTLVRRLHYDLIGLPPAPEVVEAYVADTSEGKWQQLVEKLLASPQYGVHWGRRWLDLVRWAETDSYERDRLKPGAWRYRDWVVDALNDDLPFDRFITLQLAGDELPDEGLAQHIATGYLHLGIRDDEPADPVQAVFVDLDGMLDTTSRVFLGISMGCARCHDHKGDPIPTRDYYRMLSCFEGIKPYKVGGGNGIVTGNFVRQLPSDLGTDDHPRALEAWKRDHSERLTEIENLLAEIRARWGEETLFHASDALDEGLVRHLTFDDGEDLGGDVRGAIASEGKLGTALRFAGGDHRLLIDRPVGDDFTISFWYRSEGEGAGGNSDLRWFRGTGLVDGEIPGVVDDFGISLVGDHVCAGVGRPETFIHGPSGAADGQWHHVAFTRHRQSGRIELHFDGIEVAGGKGGKQSLTSTDKLSIGRMLPDARSLTGTIDDVRFYDRVLDPREILDLAIGGGALLAYQEIIEQRLGPAEAVRFEGAVERLLTLERPRREMVEVLAAQEFGTEMKPSFVRVRGNANVEGEKVEPGVPQILGGEALEIVPPADGQTSGRRLALARWIASAKNPRTARVTVNRLWQHHFGRGLVPTPNDFGRFGLPVTHPELLDWLASEFLDENWSLKSMHWLIVSSSGYRMASVSREEGERIDPENILFWRFEPRRLSAEEIRDSILAINGALNEELEGPGVFPEMPREVLATASRPGQAWGRSTPDQAARRSLYIHVKRSLLSPFLETFDLADTDTSCPVRFNTTQPTQALTLLNSEFSQKAAARLADRLERECEKRPAALVRRALSLVSQRPPSENRVTSNINFIEKLTKEHGLDDRQALEVFCLMTLNLNEFIYLD